MLMRGGGTVWLKQRGALPALRVLHRRHVLEGEGRRRRERMPESRKRRENHGVGGRPWSAGLRGCDLVQSARESTCAAIVRLHADGPDRMIGDKAYDSDELAEELAEDGIELIAPHRKNRKPENVTQDGRPLRRYKRRWTVERTIGWIQHFRRLCIRWRSQPHASRASCISDAQCSCSKRFWDSF